MPDLLSCDPSTSSTAVAEETETRYFLPELGAWAVLTIDPVASLSAGAREVPEAVEACKQMVNKPYVALVDHNDALYLPWEPYNSYLLRLLQPGDPYHVPKSCIEPYMSVPVLPVTKETHISGRPPLKSSKALPWTDCFLSISADGEVRSPSVWGSGPALWKIDDEERGRIQESMSDDILDARDKKNAAMAAELRVGAVDTSPELLARSAIADDAALGTATEADVPSLHSPTHSDTGGQQSVYASSRDSESYDDESESDGEGSREDESGSAQEDEEPLDLMELLFFNRLHEKAMTTVRFTHNLLTVTELNDPRDYYKEVEAIKRIETEAAPRIEECRALRLQNEINRAQQMDAAVYGEHTMHMLAERVSPREEPIVAGSSEVELKSVMNLNPSTREVKADGPLGSISHDPSPAKTKGRGLIVRITSKVKKSGRAALRVLRLFRPVAI